MTPQIQALWRLPQALTWDMLKFALFLLFGAHGVGWQMLKIRIGKMSWRFKRIFTNLGYRFRAIGIPQPSMMKPSTTLLVIAAMAFVIFILAGGVFDILEKPLALLPKGSGWTFVYKGSINLQTLNESILAGLLYLLGILGLYLLLRSTRQVYNPRQAYITLILGLMVTLIAVYYCTSFLASKIGY